MTPASLARLVALAAIWGASFLFLRIVVPVLGPVLAADSRLLIGGLALAAWFAMTGFDAKWRRWWPQYAVVGMLNSAMPFLLFAYAALSLPAGILSVLNATSPMWGALFSAWLLRERITARAAIGLAIGVAGVALVTGADARAVGVLPVLAGLAAAAFYGLAGAYMRRWVRDAPARGMAVGTLLVSGLMLAPFVALAPPPGELTALVAACTLALGLLASSIAYLIYFRLVADLGATRTLTVTYLIPVFGISWGAIFLGEAITAPMLGGAALVLLGTFFVLRE